MNPPGVQLSEARGLGTRLGFRHPGAVPAIWRHAAYDLEGGGLFVVRSVVVSAGGIDGGAEVVCERWSVVILSYSVCFTGKAATGVHSDVCASVAHLAADCPLT